MSCKGWDPQIALYVGGEIEPEMQERIEHHLAECDACRNLAGDLQQNQSEFRQLRHEPIESASLSRVRTNVLSRVRALDERRSWLDRFGLRWRYAVLGCAALIVLSLGGWHLSSRTSPISSVARTPTKAKVAESVAPPTQQVAVARTKPHRKVAVLSEAAEPEEVATLASAPSVPSQTPQNDSVIRIFTDDPNIVIYWLVEDRGGD